MKNITKQALEYLQLGLSVIPLGTITLDENKKKTINFPVNWRIYENKRATEKQITEWFEITKYPNIGIVTGKISNIFVLDVDSYKPAFDKKIINDFNLPITPCQTTARGGTQYFFKYDGDARNATGIFNTDSGIDIRANGGMVVAPPSKPTYGEYTWTISPQDELFAPLPDKLAQLFHKEKKPIQDLVGLTEGSRDDSIASLVGTLSLSLPQHRWDTEIFPTIERINRTYTPPLPKKDLLRIYRSITQKELQRRCETEQQQSKYIPATKFKDFMAIDFPEARYAIEPFFELHTMNAVSAPPNTWKSWVMFLFALSIAQGKPFLDRFDAKKLSVMVVNEEDSNRLVQDRFNMIMKSKEEDTKLQDLGVWFRVSQGGKLEKEYVDNLLKEIKENNIEVVMFDSLRAMHSAEENSSTEMQNVMDMLKVFTKENITVIFTHHHRKKALFQKDGGDPEMARGSSAISAALSGHVSLEEIEREDKKYIVMRHLKSKVAQKHEPFEIAIDVVEKDTDVRFKYSGEIQSQDKKIMESKDAIYSFLQNENRWVTRKEMSGLCNASDRTIKSALLELEKEENIISKTRKKLNGEGVHVESTGDGREKLYFINNQADIVSDEYDSVDDIFNDLTK